MSPAPPGSFISRRDTFRPVKFRRRADNRHDGDVEILMRRHVPGGQKAEQDFYRDQNEGNVPRLLLSHGDGVGEADSGGS